MKMLLSTDKIAIFLLTIVALFAMFVYFNQSITTQDVYQYVDHDGRVVCYILENGNGISCLPMNEVNLGE